MKVGPNGKKGKASKDRSMIVGLKPNRTRNTGDWHPEVFSKDVVHTAYHIKTGKMPATGSIINAKPFSRQKAKAVRLSDHSFHTFVIKNPQQRSSYSGDVGEEEMILLSSKKSRMI